MTGVCAEHRLAASDTSASPVPAVHDGMIEESRARGAKYIEIVRHAPPRVWKVREDIGSHVLLVCADDRIK